MAFDASNSLVELSNYINHLKNENHSLKQQNESLLRENERLKDNEKEMFKVSTIITTSNENTKLKNYISILEEQLNKHKSRECKVVFEDSTAIPEEPEVTLDEVRPFTYKETLYFIDDNNVLYENNNDIKGEVVGYRKLNKKTNKFKTVLNVQCS